jgi:hypothetical protein
MGLNLTILLAATALLATLASGHLLLLAGLLLAALLLAGLLLAALLTALLLAGLLLAALLTALLLPALLLPALLLPALLLPALLHIAHLVVRHGEFSLAEAFRATTILLRLPRFRSGEMRLAGMPEQRRQRTVSPNYRHPERLHSLCARKMGYFRWPNAIHVPGQSRRNRAPIAVLY